MWCKLTGQEWKGWEAYFAKAENLNQETVHANATASSDSATTHIDGIVSVIFRDTADTLSIPSTNITLHTLV